jgi:energy-coupling factor transporter ATP-binding protein EcfA2
MSSPTWKSKSIEEIGLMLRELRKNPPQKQLVDDIQKWITRHAELEQDAVKPFHVAVAMLGESGAGKSSLLNALLGIDLLPHDSGSAVTTSVTELSWNDDGYVLEAELETREEFEKRFRALCGRITDALISGGEDAAASAGAVDSTDVACAKTLSGYKELSELVHALADADPMSVLLPKAQLALSTGGVLTQRFDAQPAGGLKDAATDLLSSRGALWPMVRRVRIKGPFELLKGGLRLLDVPGLNDPDPARNDIAQAAVQSAKSVWLVLNSKRAMTQTLVEFLKNSRLLSRLQMEGRLETLVVVATHADELDESALTQRHGLSENAPLDDLIALHAERIKDEVRESLRRSWEDDLARSGDQAKPEEGEHGRAILRQAPFFCVSSTEYAKLTKPSSTRRRPFFESSVQTGIPGLIEWTSREFLDLQRYAHDQNISKRREALLSLMRDTLIRARSLNVRFKDARGDKGGGVRAGKAKSRDFLEKEFQAQIARRDQELSRHRDRVNTSIGEGIASAERALQVDVVRELSNIHWATLRAIVKRNGIFTNNSRRWDIPSTIVDIICDKLVFSWSELFHHATGSFLQAICSQSESQLRAAVTMLYQSVEMVLGQESPTAKSEYPTQQLQMELDCVEATIRELVEKSQLSIRSLLHGELVVRLAPAFRRASQQEGHGMKGRMIDAIARELVGITTILPDIQRDLEDRVHEITKGLRSQGLRAQAEVRRLAERESENLENALLTKSPADLDQAIEALDEALVFFAQ